MRVIVAAVGRLKSGAERALFDKYRIRLEPVGRTVGLAPITWHELAESRAATAAQRRSEEGEALIKAARAADVLICLDAAGAMLTSRDFARLIGTVRDEGTKTLALLVGGADGLGKAAGTRARTSLSFGPIDRKSVV